MPRRYPHARRAWLAGWLVFLLAGGAAGEGTLVVAGGAVEDGNAAVYRAFIDALPDEAGRIAVISAASASPVGSAQDFAAALGRYGVAAERLVPIALAVTDDPDTDFDERDWAGNGRDAAEIAKLDGVAGVWFTGGDQRRIAEALLEDGAAPTPMLARIRALHAAGAAIGGTSAGAAIMSNPMITGGEPVAALLGVTGSDDALTTGKGLGFFEPGLVDQHFDARARLGRVAVALGLLEPNRRIALGVDEDTAFVYTPGDAQLRVAGSGNVTLVDGRGATWDTRGGRVSVRGLSLSVLSPGDRLFLTDGRFEPASYLKPTVGQEYFDREVVAGGGMAFPQPGLARTLGEELLDNRGARTLERLTVVADAGARSREAAGILFRFRQGDDSLGYWGRDEHGRSRYSVIRVGFDIAPIEISIAPDGAE